MEPKQLTELFWNDVEYTARGFKLKIAPDGRHHLAEFIEDGVNRIAEEGRLTDRKGIEQAQTNLMGFVGGMAFVAKTQGLSELVAETFFAAKKTFCPLWPFCKQAYG